MRPPVNADVCQNQGAAAYQAGRHVGDRLPAVWTKEHLHHMPRVSHLRLDSLRGVLRLSREHGHFYPLLPRRHARDRLRKCPWLDAVDLPTHQHSDCALRAEGTFDSLAEEGELLEWLHGIPASLIHRRNLH